MVAAMKRGSAEPTDLTINHLAGKIAKKEVKRRASFLPTYCFINLLKKYRAKILEAMVTKSIE